MRLRSKLTLVLLVVALIPLLVAMSLAFRTTKRTATSYVTAKLEGIARIQAERIEEVVGVYIERTNIHASQEPLLLALAEYNKMPTAQTLEELNKAMYVARAEIPGAATVNIISNKGFVLTSSDKTQVGQDRTRSKTFLQGAKKTFLNGIVQSKTKEPQIQTAGPLKSEGNLLGFVEITFDGSLLSDVTKDYTGLGETGEVIIVEADTTRNATYLNQLRFNKDAFLKHTTIADPVNTPLLIAMAGRSAVLTGKEIVDYRGHPIFAATHYIDSLKWGVVVKVDQAEVLQPAQNLALLFVGIVGLTFLLIVIFSIIVIGRITSPIKALTKAASIWQQGDFGYQVKVYNNDEVSELAQAFNSLSKKLKNYYSELEAKVQHATKDLASELAKSDEQNKTLQDTKRAVMNILEDLDEEKNKLSAATQKDEALISSIGDSMVVTDEYGEITKTNPEFEIMMGYSENELVGRGIVSAIPAATPDGNPVPPEERAVVEALSTGKPAHATYSLKRKDGSSLIVEMTASPYLINGKPAGAVVVMRDVSQQSAIDKAKTEFVSLASHQLRTPLSTINWYLEMVLGGDAGKISKEQTQYLQEIYAANQRMVTLVNSLLNVSRIDLGTFAIEPEPTDLKQTVNNVMDELKAQIFQKKLKVSTKFDDNLRPYNADPKLAHIIFQNLISNAVKYTQDGGQITIKIAYDNSHIILQVADNGFGIPRAQQKKIFTKLFRADNVIAKDTDGTGLGLYLIKAIAEEAGGSIGFVSKENAGTTFTIKLPKKGMKPREGTKGLSSVTSS